MEINFEPVIKAFRLKKRTFVRLLQEADSVVSYTESKLNGRSFWQVSPDELRFIYAITRILKPRIVVETGVGPGTTSYAFLSAMNDYGGKLYSFDLGVKYGEESDPEEVGFVVPDDLRSNWTLTLGDSKETLPEKIGSIGDVDFFFHDSEHTYKHVMFELTTMQEHLSEEFLILADNCNWTDAVADFADERELEHENIVDDLCAVYRL